MHPKSFVAITFFAMLSFNSMSQYVHRVGDISPGEIAMKECSFDPDAPAVILISEAFSDNYDYQLVTYHHMRIKILNDKGLDQANVNIPFISEDKFEKIEDIEAITINIDENGNNRKEIHIDKKSIYIKKMNNYLSEVSFAFPQVKKGSILEYVYKSTKQNFGGLRTWRFQFGIPVCFSSYELRPPRTLEFTYQVEHNSKYPVIIKPYEVTHSIYFEMDSLPALDDEPYMDSREDYIQKVNFVVTRFQNSFTARKFNTNWNEVAQQLWDNENFGGQITSHIKEAETEILPALTGRNDVQKMNYIYNIVRSRIRWTGDYSKYSYDGVKTVWNKKTGSSAGMNLLLINLLRVASLEAYPVIVSEREKGKIDKSTPFPNQFNNVYAAVIINGKNYYLDATEDFIPAKLIPEDILNTTALIIKKDKGDLVEIHDNDFKYREVTYINANLAGDGALAGSVVSSSRDYARSRNLSNYHSANDKNKYVEKYLKDGLIGVSIDSFDLSGENNDSMDLTQRFNFYTKLQSTESYHFLGLNIFSGLESNPFISNNRFSDINYGFTSFINLIWLINVPVKWEVDALPKNIRMTNTDKSMMFTREIVYNKDAGQISARLKLELNKSLYNADDYPDLKEFYKKMFVLLNEQVVFKEK